MEGPDKKHLHYLSVHPSIHWFILAYGARKGNKNDVCMHRELEILSMIESEPWSRPSTVHTMVHRQDIDTRCVNGR